jgi:hypothetical protein
LGSRAAVNAPAGGAPAGSKSAAKADKMHKIILKACAFGEAEML